MSIAAYNTTDLLSSRPEARSSQPSGQSPYDIQNATHPLSLREKRVYSRRSSIGQRPGVIRMERVGGLLAAVPVGGDAEVQGDEGGCEPYRDQQAPETDPCASAASQGDHHAADYRDQQADFCDSPRGRVVEGRREHEADLLPSQPSAQIRGTRPPRSRWCFQGDSPANLHGSILVSSRRGGGEGAFGPFPSTLPSATSACSALSRAASPARSRAG